MKLKRRTLLKVPLSAALVHIAAVLLKGEVRSGADKLTDTIPDCLPATSPDLSADYLGARVWGAGVTLPRLPDR